MVNKEVVCFHCGKLINLGTDRHSMIGTYTGDLVDDESYFHHTCFVQWYNKKVSEKAKNSVKTMQSKVQGLMANPKIAGLMSMIGGTDKLKGMLNTNLDQGKDEVDVGKLMSDFLGDDPETMKEGTITPTPKKSIDKINNDGNKKRKPRAKTPKQKV